MSRSNNASSRTGAVADTGAVALPPEEVVCIARHHHSRSFGSDELYESAADRSFSARKGGLTISLHDVSLSLEVPKEPELEDLDRHGLKDRGEVDRRAGADATGRYT